MECAFAMQERMSSINETWAKDNLEPLSASIGINTGETMVGTVSAINLWISQLSETLLMLPQGYRRGT